MHVLYIIIIFVVVIIDYFTTNSLFCRQHYGFTELAALKLIDRLLISGMLEKFLRIYFLICLRHLIVLVMIYF